MNNNPERPNLSHPSLLDIEARFAQSVSDEEAPQILEKIKEGTVLEGDYVGVPSPGSNEFELLSVDTVNTAELKKRIGQVFNDQNQPVFIYSEEESISPKGLTKFSREDFLNNVVDYLHDWGQNTNYWAFDGKTTVTFHRAGVAFWKKEANKAKANLISLPN